MPTGATCFFFFFFLFCCVFSLSRQRLHKAKHTARSPDPAQPTHRNLSSSRCGTSRAQTLAQRLAAACSRPRPAGRGEVRFDSVTGTTLRPEAVAGRPDASPCRTSRVASNRRRRAVDARAATTTSSSSSRRSRALSTPRTRRASSTATSSRATSCSASTRARDLDFGLARDVSGESRVDRDAATLLGTPAYMSPEQIAGSASRSTRGPTSTRSA